MLKFVLIALIAACGTKNSTESGSETANKSDEPPAGSNTKPAADGSSSCQRAVGHVMDLMAAESRAHDAVPGPDEQRAIDEVARRSIERCEIEGLTRAQLDCLLAATDWERFKQIADCPAIRVKSPSWLKGG